jgi:glycine/D-amino acid oxidase-like deaminating enzyme
VTSSHIVLTEPVPDVLEEVGWTGGECITDCRTMLHYFRTTPDGRIAFGFGGGRISFNGGLHGRVEVDPEVVAMAAERLRAYFPALEGREITHAWGGPIDVSPTHLPLVMPLRGGRAFVTAGYTGNGVGPANMVGRVMASLALDRRDEPSQLAIVDPSPHRVPPEPFHWIGGSLIRRGIMSKENAEANGHRPNLLATAIAKVPELIGFHIGR